MTAEQVSSLGPAFTEFLSSFRGCFPRRESFAHLGTYCRGLISDLARKSVEPIALAGGCAVRTLQEFLTHHAWDHDAPAPSDPAPHRHRSSARPRTTRRR